MNYEDIIKQIRNKDTACLETLYVTYGEKFYDYCIRKWNLSEDAAWEVVYQTLETIILKGALYNFESEKHFTNFLFKVLINFLRQQYRKKQATRENLEFVNLNADDELPDIIQKQIEQQSFIDYYKAEVVNSPAISALNAALSKLDPLDKDLLLLKAQNYTYDEIASILKIENNQLKVRHHRAKNKLINLLKGISYEHS